ncbi:zinc-binding dehydrogenase, partial [Actinomadura kijaniata]
AGFMLVEPDRAGLLAITEMVEAGSLRPVVEKELPLEEAAEAHRLAERGGNLGKIVLTVD